MDLLYFVIKNNEAEYNISRAVSRVSRTELCTEEAFSAYQ